jgi:hypothetical protein
MSFERVSALITPSTGLNLNTNAHVGDLYIRGY